MVHEAGRRRHGGGFIAALRVGIGVPDPIGELVADRSRGRRPIGCGRRALRVGRDRARGHVGRVVAILFIGIGLPDPPGEIGGGGCDRIRLRIGRAGRRLRGIVGVRQPADADIDRVVHHIARLVAVIEAERVAELVHHRGEKIDVDGRLAAGGGELGWRKQRAEFEVVVGSLIDGPRPAGGIVVDRNVEPRRAGENAVVEVGDRDHHAVELCGLLGRDAGVGPALDGFRHDRCQYVGCQRVGAARTLALGRRATAMPGSGPSRRR